MKKPSKDYINAVDFPQNINVVPIGIVRSPYKERHGTPRQAVLSATPKGFQPSNAQIEIFESIPEKALNDIEGFDRIWIISYLHLNVNWNPTVRIPRGPKNKYGTLSTRAPHRPNPIGLSCVKLTMRKGRTLHVEGIDLLDGTPIIDIKPYVPYCDAFPQAKAGYVDDLERQGIREADIK